MVFNLSPFGGFIKRRHGMANKHKSGTRIYKFEKHFETVLEYRENRTKVTHTESTRITKTVIRRRDKKENKP
jgi:hypothetical protein